MKKSLIFTLMLTFSLFVNGQTQYPVIVIETNFGTMKAIL
jgi:peptidyl-prolyl cis-trans isomerase B (cyclophilin B)